MGIKSSKVLESYGKSDQLITAELQRSEGLQGGAPFLSKFGNSSSLENLVRTSPYERASEPANAVRTDSGGGGEEPRGNTNGGTEERHLFWRDF